MKKILLIFFFTVTRSIHSRFALSMLISLFLRNLVVLTGCGCDGENRVTTSHPHKSGC